MLKKIFRYWSIYFNKEMYSSPRPIWIRLPRWFLIHWRLGFLIMPFLLFICIYLIPLLTSKINLTNIIIINILYTIASYLYPFLVISLLFASGMFIAYTLFDNKRPWALEDYLQENTAIRQRKEVEQQHIPGFKLRHRLQGHRYTINGIGIAWSHDEEKLATGSDDWSVRLWDMKTGQLLHTLTDHTDAVNSVAWSPDGHSIASASQDKTVQLWNVETGQLLHKLTGHTDAVNSVAWSPDNSLIASGSNDSTIRVWNSETGEVLLTFERHADAVNNVAWSPDGYVIASCSKDRTIRLWDPKTGQLFHTLTDHIDSVNTVTWSPDGRTVASGSKDKTVRIWDPKLGRQMIILEGHTNSILCISFSSGGHLLASKSDDRTVRLWRSDTWEIMTTLHQPVTNGNLSGALAFHPKLPLLVTLAAEEAVINIWDLDLRAVLSATPTTPAVRYTNAKIILIGDTSVGKTGLSLVLTNQLFVPTESTHGRHVWNFDTQEISLDEGRKERREILLWDLAGQPGYRLIHQLYLNEVAVALVIFDARNETDPFAGVYYWDRALRLAQRLQSMSNLTMKKFLVAARTDRGGIGVSHARIESLIRELGFDGFFETSAKDRRNITELKAAIQKAVDWNTLPRVSSTELFQDIKAFLVAEKEAGRLLSTIDDLFRSFQRLESTTSETEDLYAQFETCIGRVESRDLIRKLSFGKLILLQPELLDAYASALINAVRDEPDGLGSILEEKIRIGDFAISENERIKDREQEKLLLIAMIEDLLRHEIALREQADDGPHLIFPSQSTREHPDLPDPKGKAIVFDFEGPVQNIYATLAVRLSHSGLFKKKELWKNAVIYTTIVGGIFGMFLHNIGEGRGQLTLFFDENASEETRFHFEKYIESHLKQRALSESIQRIRIFTCNGCGFLVTEQLVQLRAARGLNWLDCPSCSMRIKLLDREERFTAIPLSLIQEMDRAADTRRNLETAQTILEGKIKTSDFDVFLCHKGDDKPAVKKIGELLKERGILPWLDEWELRPGLPWQPLLEQQIGKIKSAAVFVGKDGIGPWQQVELDSFLREFVRRGCPVIPILLADAQDKPLLPVFLQGMTWVDFHMQDSNPMERLIWGITGDRERIR